MTSPCCKCSRCGATFQCTNGEMKNGYASSMCWAIFSPYCGQRTMTTKGTNRNVLHLLQAQQAPICLWSISETLQCQKFRGIVTKSIVSNRVCWPPSIKCLQSPQLPLLHFVTVNDCCLLNRALHNIFFSDFAFAVYFLKIS